MIPLVLAGDQPTVRAGLRMRLALENDIQIIGAARDGNEAVYVAHRLKPDIVIMDLEMPIYYGSYRIIERHPATGVESLKPIDPAHPNAYGGITGLVIAALLFMFYVANTMGS